MNCDGDTRHWHIWIVTQEASTIDRVYTEGQIIASWQAENIGFRGGIYSSRDWQIETIGFSQ
jgi:hypothetical protein